MGVCGSRSSAVTVASSISIEKQISREQFSQVVNSKRTAVPRLQPVHSNPLHARRKAKFQSVTNALRTSSALETMSASGPLEYFGQENKPAVGVTA